LRVAGSNDIDAIDVRPPTESLRRNAKVRHEKLLRDGPSDPAKVQQATNREVGDPVRCLHAERRADREPELGSELGRDEHRAGGDHVLDTAWTKLALCEDTAVTLLDMGMQEVKPEKSQRRIIPLHEHGSRDDGE